MKTHFTLTEQQRTLAIAVILFFAVTGCKSKTAAPGYDVKLVANPTENARLTTILFCRDRDSVVKYAQADFKQRKYYLFKTTVPFDGVFDVYFALCAQQKYGVTFVNCGAKSYQGAFYYNEEMAKCVSKAKVKPVDSIYLEAKSNFSKMLETRYADSAGN
jgi:hypothetical protein